jgi:hypothetical protein
MKLRIVTLLIGGTVHKQILINAKLRNGKRSQKTADWAQSVTEMKVHIGLYCHLRKGKKNTSHN